jgi:hypothetical protein
LLTIAKSAGKTKPLGKPQVQALADTGRPPNIGGHHSYVNVTRGGVPIRDYVNLQSDISSGGECCISAKRGRDGGVCCRGCCQPFWGVVSDNPLRSDSFFLEMISFPLTLALFSLISPSPSTSLRAPRCSHGHLVARRRLVRRHQAVSSLVEFFPTADSGSAGLAER